MKSSLRPQAGFTLVEILVVIAIVGILVGLALGPISKALDKGQMVDTLNNARNVTLATRMMDTDAQVSGVDGGWPGETDWAEFGQNLIDGDYMSEADLVRALRAPGVNPSEWDTDESALRFYQVTAASPNNAVFISTFNWDATAPGELDSTLLPYGDKGFVYVTKSGEAKVGQPQFADNEHNDNDNVLQLPEDDGAQPDEMGGLNSPN